jgi:hypothetical protein
MFKSRRPSPLQTFQPVSTSRRVEDISESITNVLPSRDFYQKVPVTTDGSA